MERGGAGRKGRERGGKGTHVCICIGGAWMWMCTCALTSHLCEKAERSAALHHRYTNGGQLQGTARALPWKCKQECPAPGYPAHPCWA